MGTKDTVHSVGTPLAQETYKRYPPLFYLAFFGHSLRSAFSTTRENENLVQQQRDILMQIVVDEKAIFKDQGVFIVPCMFTLRHYNT
jgi:hypothetical protein